MARVGLEPTTPVPKRAESVRTSKCAATVTGELLLALCTGTCN
jgi:hypothetical protein